MTALLKRTAKITSKGQTTVPQAVRQALGVGCGDVIEYVIRGDQVTVTNPNSEHRDPALEAFLSLIERDIANGRNVNRLPHGLVASLRRAMKEVEVNLDQPVEGEVHF
jgi:antitoxin PrlF